MTTLATRPELLASFQQGGLPALTRARELADRLLDEDGVTYHRRGLEEPWALDPVPFVLQDGDWRRLERGLVQRAHLLDHLLTDLYGPREVLRSGLLPAEVVLAHDGFLRDCDGIRLPGDRQLFLSAVDLVHTGGGWRALGDRTQAPSGAAYAMENRRVVSRVAPEIYRETSLHRLSPFFQAMRVALTQVAPPTADSPRVVILSPGAASETAFDQAYLATLLGYPLVEGADLTVQGGRVWLRTLGRLEQVHVILRRVDAAWCDPLELRPESRLGVPGLVEACRRGQVCVVNTLGSGVLENPGLLPYLPGLCQALLGEPLQLASVPTWWCGDDTARRYVLSRLSSLVIRPLSRTSRRSVFGAELSSAELELLARRIETDPVAYVAQDAVGVGTALTTTSTGLAPRRAILRSFAVAEGGSYRVMAGGLTRVARETTQLYVSQGVGALAKDTWVLSTAPAPPPTGSAPEGPLTPTRPETGMAPRVVEDLFWFGRYIERAQSLLRLLRAAHNCASDHHLGHDPAGARALRLLLGAVTTVSDTHPGFLGAGAPMRLADPYPELTTLLVDATRPGTVAHAVAGAEAAAQSVRDQLSPDTFLVLRGIERVLQVPREDPTGTGRAVAAAYGRVLEGLLALDGVVVDTMVRDPGWHLLDAGRRIERGLAITALLGATLGVGHPLPVEAVLVDPVLSAGESTITHRRRYPDNRAVGPVFELLLVDPDNPRSLRHQLDRLHDDLAAATAAGGSPRPGHLLDSLIVRLGRFDPASLGTPAGRDVSGQLHGLHRELSELADTIRSRMFHRLAGPQPL